MSTLTVKNPWNRKQITGKDVWRMIKGCAKRVVVVKDIDSNLFEEAFFIVRQGTGAKKYAKEDFLGEAGRLVKTTAPYSDGGALPLADGAADGAPLSRRAVRRSAPHEGAFFSVRAKKGTALRDALMFVFGFGSSCVLCTLIYYSGIFL